MVVTLCESTNSTCSGNISGARSEGCEKIRCSKMDANGAKPAKEKKGKSSSGKNGGKSGSRSGSNKGALSPMEYFEMARMRQQALASRFGGSLDIDEIQSLKISQDPSAKDLTVIMAKLNELKLKGSSDEEKSEDKLQSSDSEKGISSSESNSGDHGGPILISRGPVPVYSANRFVYQPYGNKNSQSHKQQQELNQVVPSDFQPTHPSQYMGYQRQKQQQSLSPGFVPESYSYQQSGYDFDQPYQHHFSPDDFQEFRGSSGYGSGQQPVIDTSPHHSVPSPPESFSPGSAPDLAPHHSPNHSISSLSSNHMGQFSIENVHSELGNFFQHNSELPDDLTDFILQYSRRYSTSTDTSGSVTSPAASHSGSESVESSSPRKNSVESSSGASSPAISIGSRSSCSPPLVFSENEQSSPATSRGKSSPSASPPNGSPRQPSSRRRIVPIDNRIKNIRSRSRPTDPMRVTIARDRLRVMISDADFETGWAWAAKCWHAAPQTLCFLRDGDGDTFLHRVVYHKDLAKIYGLVEHMLKDESPLCPKAYDLSNSNNETPLFVAVQRRLAEVVAYLLECGANPNIRTWDRTGDGPLHYAAARGMAEVVATLASSQKTDKNMPNSQGLTPLLCAVKYHGVIEEESQCLVNNKPTIRSLLMAGADATIPEGTYSRKTVLHYAVERMDPDLVQIFCDHLPADKIKALVNTASTDGNTPLHTLSQVPEARGKLLSGPNGLARGEEVDEMRKKMFFILVRAGADTNRVNAEGQYPVVPCGGAKMPMYQE